MSGHPARDEIKQMYDWLKPEIVIPVHGEKVMIEDQAELALLLSNSSGYCAKQWQRD